MRASFRRDPIVGVSAEIASVLVAEYGRISSAGAALVDSVT
jgi:hypothetical protein